MKTTYKVSGLTRFMGHAPGETFEDELDAKLEARAKERGSIKVVKRSDDKPEKGGGDA